MKKVNFLQGSISGQMILFAIPIFFGNLFQQLYNAADSLIVGNFLGSNSLAAVTSTGSLIMLLVGFFHGMSQGASVVIARYFGSGDYKRVKEAISTALILGVIGGLVLTFIGVTFTPGILRLMGSPDNVIRESVLYLRVYFLGAVTLVMYNVCQGILQAVGDSKSPLIYLIISSVINILLDLIFNGLFHLGVAYAALATILSQTVSVLLCLRQMTCSQDIYRLNLKEIVLDRPLMVEILSIGIPSGFQHSIISIANVVVQSNINSFGSDAMAGCGSYSKLEGFGFLPITSFSISISTFVSQNLGAKQYDRAKKGAAFGVLGGILCAEAIGAGLWIFAPWLVALFGNTPASLHYGVLQAKIVGLFYCLLAFSHLMAGVLRGAGRALVPMYVFVSIWCLFRVSYITIAIHFIHMIQVVFWAYPLTWTISGIIFVIYFRKVDWTKPSR